MNSKTNRRRKLNEKRKRTSNRIIYRDHLKKTKKKKILPNFFKEYLITNWIENDDDNEQSESLADLNFFHKNCPMKTTNEDEDSLHIENLHHLSTMKNIIFLDLDNFSSFFQHLTNPLPEHTYILAFYGSNIQWKSPKNHLIYEKLLKSHHFQLMHPSGHRHDAADFALVLTFGKLHGLLRKSISFTIVSGDKGFLEIIHQLKNSKRRINWFNPHQSSFEDFNQILNLASTLF